MNRPNRNEFSKLPIWARNALLQGLKKQGVKDGVRRCIAERGALIIQMVRSKNTGRVVIVQYPVAGVTAAYARLVCPDMSTTSEYVCYVVVASAPALEEADRRGVPYMCTDRRGVPYMCTLRPSDQTRRAAEVLRVPRSLFEEAEAQDA